jgi:hypothetical protein
MRIADEDIGDGEMAGHPWRDDTIPQPGNNWRSRE